MNELTANFIRDIGGWGQEGFMIFVSILPALKIISLFISVLLIGAIIHAIRASGYYYWYSDRWADRMGRNDLPQRRAQRAWARAVRLIQNKQDRAQWIAALQQVDKVLEDGLKIKGDGAVIIHMNEMNSARKLFTRAFQNTDFPLTHESALQALRSYKKVLKELKMI